MEGEIVVKDEDDCVIHMLEICDKNHEIIEHFESGDSDTVSFFANINRFVILCNYFKKMFYQQYYERKLESLEFLFFSQFDFIFTYF